MYKEDKALNNLQWLICHKTKPINSVYIYIYIYIHTHQYEHLYDIPLNSVGGDIVFWYLISIL